VFSCAVLSCYGFVLWYGLGHGLVKQFNSTAWRIIVAGRAPVVSADVAAAALVLDWGAVVLTWALWRPVHTALAWSWNSYLQALEKTEQLRDHQVELGRVNRSLNDAYSRPVSAGH